MTSAQTRSQTDQKVCLICQNTNQALHYRGVEDLEYHSYHAVDYLNCPSCGLIWQYPSPAKQLLPSFYPENYRNYKPVKRDLLVFLKDLQAAAFASRIARHIGGNRQAKILDIGFGNGQLLLALSKQGFRHLYGSDFNSRDCSYLEERGIQLAFSDIEERFPFVEKFDCIVMNNVIEHFLDPVRVIELCREHLRDNGCLIMVTPNAEAMELALFDRFWAGFHAPRHTFLFSKRSLEVLSKSLKFSSLSLEGFNDPGQWAISVQNMLQSMPATKSTLKNGLAWYAVPLSLLVSPLVLLQNILGKSTAIMCVLKKKDLS